MTLEEENALLRAEVERHMPATGSERIRLRALLGLPAEPCRGFEHDGSRYCSTHGEFWHQGHPRPAVPCFADAPEWP